MKKYNLLYKRSNGILRNLYFIYMRVRLALKENVQYRANLYSAIIINIVMVCVALLFFSVYKKLSNNVLGFEDKDFILYVIIVLAGSKAYHMFSLKHFKIQLLNGHLNLSLVRPFNPFIYHSLFYVLGPVLIIFPLLVLIIFGLILYYGYVNIFYFWFFFIFSFFYSAFFFSFISSTAFFLKENEFLSNIAVSSNTVVEIYTPKMFQSVSKTLIYLFPSALFGYVGLEILRGNFNLVLMLLPVLIFTFIFFIISIYFMWKVGLKKYEAFG